MATESINISIAADIRALKSELGKMENVGHKEATRLVDAMAKQYRRAEKEARKMAQATEKASKEAFDGAGKAGKAFGGTIGGAVTIMEDFTDGLSKMSGALGPVGTAFAASTLGAAALGFAATKVYSALTDVADAALAARDRLRESREYYEISPEAIASLDRYAAASRELTQAVDEATVAVGGRFADDLAVLKTRIADVTGNIVESTSATEGWLRSSLRVMSLGVADYFLGSADATKESTKAQLDALAAWDESQRSGADFLKNLDAMAKANTDVADETDGAAAAEKARKEALKASAAATREAEQAARDYHAALREGAAEINDHYKEEAALIARREAANESLQAIILAAQADVLTGEERAIRAHWERLEAIEEAGQAASNTGDIIKAQQESELRLQRELMALQEAKSSEQSTQLAQATEETTTFWQRLEDAHDAWKEMDFEDKFTSIASSAGMAFGSITSLMEQQSEQMIANLQDEIERRRENQEEWRDGELERVEAAVASGEMSEKQAIVERRNIEAEAKAKRKALKQTTQAERQAALDSFEATKKLQIVQATIDSLAAGIALIPAFAYLGPGAPLAAAGVAGVALATAIGGINAQEAPTFEAGGMVAGRMGIGTTPDHVTIAARPDEGVLTGRGVQSAGGPAGVEALNRGQGGMGGTVNLIVDGRTLASAAIGHMGEALLQPTPGSFAAGRRPLYG